MGLSTESTWGDNLEPVYDRHCDSGWIGTCTERQLPNLSLIPGTALEDFTRVVSYALPAISPFCF